MLFYVSGAAGTGKTMLAKAIASNIDANFLKVVSSAIVDKYIGESARIIREMFNYARDHQPCIIFMDEVDAIGGKRYAVLSPLPLPRVHARADSFAAIAPRNQV